VEQLAVTDENGLFNAPGHGRVLTPIVTNNRRGVASLPWERAEGGFLFCGDGKLGRGVEGELNPVCPSSQLVSSTFNYSFLA